LVLTALTSGLGDENARLSANLTGGTAAFSTSNAQRSCSMRGRGLPRVTTSRRSQRDFLLNAKESVVRCSRGALLMEWTTMFALSRSTAYHVVLDPMRRFRRRGRLRQLVFLGPGPPIKQEKQIHLVRIASPALLPHS